MKKKLQQIINAGILFSIFIFGFFTSPAVTPDYTQMLYPTDYIDVHSVDNSQNALKGAGDVTAVFNATDDRVTYFNIPALPSNGVSLSIDAVTYCCNSCNACAQHWLLRISADIQYYKLTTHRKIGMEHRRNITKYGIFGEPLNINSELFNALYKV